VTRYPTAEVPPHVLICRFDAPLHFANAEFFASSLRKRLRVMAAQGDEPTHVLMDCSSIHTIDASANQVLRNLISELHKNDVAFILTNTRAHFRESLAKFGTLDAFIGENNMFLSLLDALENGCSRPRQPPRKTTPDESDESATSIDDGDRSEGGRGRHVDEDEDEEFTGLERGRPSTGNNGGVAPAPVERTQEVRAASDDGVSSTRAQGLESVQISVRHQGTM